MYILETKNLTKKFGKFTAVDNISLTLSEGEILGVLGPNGAGKTTTIQMLLGILTPTQGEVLYFGKKLSDNREEIMEQISFSSTYTNLPWWLTVQQNLLCVAQFYDIKNRKKRIEEIVEIFKLSDILNEVMTDLSSGQLTRVNLAKAFLNFPKILLLDEPTASLDVEIAKYIRNFLLNERKKFKTSIIITSHNMTEVEELCDRVIVINNGKIIADDTPDELRNSIKISHIELFIKSNLEKLTKYCKEQKVSYKLEGKIILIDMQSSKIAKFLEELSQMDVSYNEISIEKPSLEDYFLQAIERRPDEIT